MRDAYRVKGTIVTARRHLSSVPVTQRKRAFGGICGRYHVGIVTTIAVVMASTGVWMRSDSEAAVPEPVAQVAQMANVTPVVAYFPTLYINQAKIAEEHIAAY